MFSSCYARTNKEIGHLPASADSGEMIVHQPPQLTMLFTCIAQLQWAEISMIFEADEDGDGLRLSRKVRSDEGQVV